MAWTRLKIFILSVALGGCSGMAVKIDSQPSGADVYHQVNKQQKKLGVTPLDLKSDQVAGPNIHLIIRKQGYAPQTVLFEKRTMGSQAEIFAQLNKGSDARGIASVNDGVLDKKVAKVSRTVASIQSQLIKKDFQSAQSLAQGLVAEYPYFAVGWNLLGNAYYLQNRHQDALSAYYKAIEYDPDNLETQNLIDRIENKPSRSER